MQNFVAITVGPWLSSQFVHNNAVWSSAGISAGIDLPLAFIVSEAGDDAAGKVPHASGYCPAAKSYGKYEDYA